MKKILLFIILFIIPLESFALITVDSFLNVVLIAFLQLVDSFFDSLQ